jgi:rhamnose transport system permease protein
MTGVTSEIGASKIWQRINVRDVAMLGVLVIVIVINSFARENFASTTTVGYLLLDAIPIMMLALPMTFIIISAEIDLSVASIVGISAATIGALVLREENMVVAALSGVGVGVLAGAFNGFLVAYLGLPSLAATIGTLALYRGLALVIIGDASVGSFPETWTSFVQGKLGGTGVPTVTIAALLFIGLAIIVLHYSPFGRGLFALGHSQDAARFVGVKVEHAKFWLFVASGLVAGLVGLYWALRYGSARSDSAAGLELTVIAAVLLGGVSIFGGRGSIPGVVIAVLLVATITYGFRLQRISDVVLVMITGGLLIASVTAPNYYQRIRERWRLISRAKDSPAD